MRGAQGRDVMAPGRGVRRELVFAEDILSPWKALSSADEAFCLIVAGIGLCMRRTHSRRQLKMEMALVEFQ